MVLLHGSASSSKQWRSLTDYLKGRFRIICPDLPGNGRSAAPAETQRHTLETTARTVAELIELYGEPVHLVGHSFGCAVALKIATLWPEKIRSMTLIEPAAFNAIQYGPKQAAPDIRDFIDMGQTVQSLADENADADATATFIDFWNGAGSWVNTSTGLQVKLTHCLHQVLNDFKALENDHLSDQDLAGVVCPVQIMRGTCSPKVIAMLSRHLIDRLPFAVETKFTGAGHMLPLTDPHLTDPAIGNFLMQVDRLWQTCESRIALAA